MQTQGRFLGKDEKQRNRENHFQKPAVPSRLGLLFILPITAVMSRVLHKKTGSVWLGGFLTAFIVLVFTISHMVVSI